MSKCERGVVKDSNLTIGLAVLATKSTTNGPRRRRHSSRSFNVVFYVALQKYYTRIRSVAPYQFHTQMIQILSFNQDVLIWTCQRVVVRIHNQRKRKRNSLVYEMQHKLNETRKCPICCILLTIIHKINHIDKPFTCPIIIVFKHYFTHSIQKLGLLDWPNT